jgi:hypothetical protein
MSEKLVAILRSRFNKDKFKAYLDENPSEFEAVIK